MDEDNKVQPIPVRFKKPPEEEPRVVEIKRHTAEKCSHEWGVTYVIRPGETEVECSGCGTKLDPMWVLHKLAAYDGMMHRTRSRYLNEMKRLKDRSRTKCEACGHMTRISRR